MNFFNSLFDMIGEYKEMYIVHTEDDFSYILSKGKRGKYLDIGYDNLWITLTKSHTGKVLANYFGDESPEREILNWYAASLASDWEKI